MLVRGKVAVVTGAGRGLGLAIARDLVEQGASVVLAGRDGPTLAAAAQELGGAQVATVEVDLRHEAAAAELVRAAEARFGRIDILVNNAGVYAWRPFLELAEEDWQEALAVNLSAPLRLIQLVAKGMIARGQGGAVVNIGSVHGVVPEAHAVAQCTTKAGLAALTRATAEALRPYDIRVNAVAPGAIDSDPSAAGHSPASRVSYGDVARLVTLLASDTCGSVTGSVIDAFGSTHAALGDV